MVGYHYMFIILKYFKVYPNLNEVVSISPSLEFTQMFITYANLNEPVLLYPDPCNGAQV